MVSPSTLGQRLRNARKLRSRTQQRLARESGITAAVISHFETVRARRQSRTVAEEPLPRRDLGSPPEKGHRFGIIVSDACPPKDTGAPRWRMSWDTIIWTAIWRRCSTGQPRCPVPGRLPPQPQEPLEREAAWFASELLVPTLQLASRIEARPPSTEAIQSLAKEFRTSLTMMAIR